LDAELRKLEWRCRRGMKELDILLLRYLHRHLATAPLERALFAEFLELPDPIIARYLIAGDIPENERYVSLCRALRTA
jgi:antitoxin CptB